MSGPDGNLWFTEVIGNRIGQATTAGDITDFPIPTASTNPYAITVGSDGALWFAEIVGNQIGRSTTAGAITEFHVPTADSQPNGIAAGPDGALWFTQSNANKIGRMTVPVPTSLFTLAACRVIDTRSTDAPALSGGSNRTFTITGKCGIPAEAKAVAVNVTVAAPTASGDLRIYPGGPLPLVSTVNFGAGKTRANNAIVSLSAAGEIVVRCDMAAGQSVQMILDVTGFFP